MLLKVVSRSTVVFTCSNQVDDRRTSQAYIADYTGHAKINRLVFIATKSAGKPLELEALKLAANELKKVPPRLDLCRAASLAGREPSITGARCPHARMQTLNTTAYRDVIGHIGGRAGPEFDLDL